MKIIYKCIFEIYDLDSAHFLSAPGLAWQGAFKKTGAKLELLIDNDMLLMVEKGIRDGICHAIHRYAEANNKYMKNCDKRIESSYLMCLDANNLYEWGMSQRLSVNGFKWEKKVSKFDEDFVKNYDEDSNKGYILEVDVDFSKKLLNLYMDLPFLPEKKELPFLPEKKEN